MRTKIFLISMLLLSTTTSGYSFIRIGTFGDSITKGAGFNLVTCGSSYKDLGSYRYYLIPRLEEANIPIDMVGLWGDKNGESWVIGEEARMNDNNWMLSDILDMDHTGWGSITAEGLVDYLIQVDAAEQLFPKPNPVGSIAILHIGTNDALLGSSIEETIYNVRNFIVYMTEHDPTISLIICQILPTRNLELNFWIDAYNLQLNELVKEMSETQNNIHLVDMNTPMRAIWDLMSIDNLHPNCDGYLLMASTLFSFLMNQGIIQPITCGGIN
jgi:lysophospholipase L1-like esterase